MCIVSAVVRMTTSVMGGFIGKCIGVTTREVADLDKYICHPRYSRGIQRWVKVIDIAVPQAEAFESLGAL